MDGPIALGMVVVLFPIMLILWNRQRVKGKMLCFFVREDKSVYPRLCELRDAFVIFGTRAYDIYPDFIRLSRFPMGWPAFLQELVPCALYDEEDAIPLDWINLGNRLERSMELKAALDENWLRKLVEETAKDSGALGINWRKILPIMILILGAVGLAAVMFLK